MKRTKIKILDKNTIAVCGLDCRLCPVFEPTVNQREKKKIPETCKEICSGCRIERAAELAEKGRSSCEIYNCCVKIKKKEFCYQCEMYPCRILSSKSESKETIKKWLKYYNNAAPP